MAQADAVRSDDRGQNAQSPAQIPPGGWKDVLWRTFKEIGDDRVTLVAAGATYFLLLALFPSLTAFVSLYGLFTDPATVAEHVTTLSSFIPEGVQIIQEQLARVIEQGAPTLGFALLTSLALALWSASAGVKALFAAMNIAYDEAEKRNFFLLNATAFVVTFAGVIVAALAAAVVLAIPGLLSVLGLGRGLEWLIQIGGYVVLALLLLTGITALYHWGPSRHKDKWRWITPGALVAVTIILVVSLLFSWYAANFANFDKTYGSLGALIGFLTWGWVSTIAINVGAELNSETERPIARDSTTREDASMGQRHATVADTLGGELEGVGATSSERSEEWQAGYAAGLRRHTTTSNRVPLRYFLPAALAARLLREQRKPSA